MASTATTKAISINCSTSPATAKPLAVYRALYGDYGVWVRPLAMFTESVDTANGSMAQFALEKALD